MRSNAETFIGFCMRSGKYRIGANACFTLKRANLILLSMTASENAEKDAKKLARKFNCKLLKTAIKPLEEYTHRENSKIMAILDGEFAKILSENADNEFIEVK